MQIEIIDINKLLPYINNPRKNLNIDKVASSIKEFGFQQPIVVDKNYTIIVGHTRFEAAKKLGLKEVPVQVADLSINQAKAYRIADNRTGELATWDFELLTCEAKDLIDMNFDVELTGFNLSDLALDFVCFAGEHIFDGRACDAGVVTGEACYLGIVCRVRAIFD